eukprot:3763641-Karenia_brevis.AAC.2
MHNGARTHHEVITGSFATPSHPGHKIPHPGPRRPHDLLLPRVAPATGSFATPSHPGHRIFCYPESPRPQEARREPQVPIF